MSCRLSGTWAHRTAAVHHVAISELDVLLSAATVGMPLIASDPLQERPLLEMCWRILMVQTNLRPNTSGHSWTRSQAYDRLDPSEKVSVSYFLGMVQGHLIATRLLGFTHLVHVDRLLVLGGKRLRGKRPDFVAVQLRPGGKRAYSATWESKGRTHGFSKTALADAKIQAGKIPAIANLTPRETIASESYFDRAGRWASELRDPEWEGDYLDLGLETYLLAYYLPIVQAGRDSGTWEEQADGFEFAVPGTPLTLTLPRVVVEAVDTVMQLDVAERDGAGILQRAWTSASATSDSRRDLVGGRLKTTGGLFS